MTLNTPHRTAFATYVAKSLLVVSGLLAAGIATMIIFVPDAFYAGYGIDPGANVNLASELKAPAGMLLISGLLMFAGIIRSEFVIPSLGLATVLYLSYGLSRLVSMSIDGVPDSALVSAALLEIVVGLSCYASLRYLRKSIGSDSMVLFR